MAIATFLQLAHGLMHHWLVVHTLVKSTGTVTLFETGSGNLRSLSVNPAKKSPSDGTIGDIGHLVLTQQRNQVLLVVTADGVVLPLIVAGLHVAFLLADSDVSLHLIKTEVGKPELFRDQCSFPQGFLLAYLLETLSLVASVESGGSLHQWCFRIRHVTVESIDLSDIVRLRRL